MLLDQLLLLAILAAILVLLLRNYPADLVFMGGLTLVVVLGVVPVEKALAGFANEGMLTVGALFIVANAMRDTGAIQSLMERFLGNGRSLPLTQLRVIGPVTLLSGVLNNTPIVATFIPALQAWSQRFGVSASKLMLPLSYAAILGGTCTMIGTSTNLIINGLLIGSTGEPLPLFAPAVIGLPLALLGIGYILLASPRLLPDRRSVTAQFANTREYTIELIVADSANPLVGKSIEEAGLRHLSGVYLAEVNRHGRVIAAVDSSERLQAGDQLVFIGMVDAIADLQRVNGLVPATNQVFKLNAPRHERQLIEAVVSPSNPLNGLTVKEGRFRHRYDAVILAVCRNGERLNAKVGDVRLRTGDVLLLEAPRDFLKQYGPSNDFLLVSSLAGPPVHNTHKAGLSWVILLAMVAAATVGLLSMFQAALLAAGAMIVTGCLHANNARRSINWQVLMVIGASLGLGAAMMETGTGERIASGILSLAGRNPLSVLIAIYLVTWILTELVTNNAAAALVFPIAFSLAAELGVSHLPFIMAILFAASASFSTPIGYQTNLMVLGPGGYRFSDYLRFGLPLNLIAAATSLYLISVFFAF